jgi:tRNA U38,U39,U40 pseudouridine synthase TruA
VVEELRRRLRQNFPSHNALIVEAAGRTDAGVHVGQVASFHSWDQVNPANIIQVYTPIPIETSPKLRAVASQLSQNLPQAQVSVRLVESVLFVVVPQRLVAMHAGHQQPRQARIA